MKRRRLAAALPALLLAAAAGGTLAARDPRFDFLFVAAQRRLAPLLGASTAGLTSTPPAQVRLSIETHVLRAISPLIYGVSVVGAGELDATGARLHRWGGDPNTRYNWALGSAWNAARDWEFRNYGGAATSASSSADAFVELNRARGVASMITVPAIGWVARNGDSDTRSQGVPAAGGPPLAPGSDGIIGYDPSVNRTLTSVPSQARKGAPYADPPSTSDASVAQDEWVHHLVSRFGAASAGGVSFYVVDNEPDLWSATHTDVHPVEPDYEDMVNTFVEYAEAIKDVDPSAQVLGPAVSGWTGYLYSARDRGSDNFRTHADRLAHGDLPFLAWWLDQVRQHDAEAGRRTLDALDVHYYPQAAGVFSSATDPATSELRLRSTRSLWDPSYVDESWIGEAVELIPRLRRWIDQYYPGTRLAIDEWNWGADQTLNGALAIADVLGIYGREGVDLAAYWTSPPVGSPGACAFELYTNYDGQGHGFGDAALVASSDHPDDVAVFASRDSSSGALLIIAINRRSDAAISAIVEVDGGAPATAHLYRYAGDHPEGLQDLGEQPIPEGLVLPASSITLVRIAP